MTIENLVEGWTERINETLLADGVAQDLTGMTVALQLYDSSGRSVAFSGTAGVVLASAGTVYFDPAASDLVASKSPYKWRWKVTDSGGKIAYFPNEAAVLVNVSKP